MKTSLYLFGIAIVLLIVFSIEKSALLWIVIAEAYFLGIVFIIRFIQVVSDRYQHNELKDVKNHISKLYRRFSSAKRDKDAKRKANDENAISFDLPDFGYDPTGRHPQTKFEKLAEADEVAIETIAKPTNRQKVIDAKRERRSDKSRKRIHH